MSLCLKEGWEWRETGGKEENFVGPSRRRERGDLGFFRRVKLGIGISEGGDLHFEKRAPFFWETVPQGIGLCLNQQMNEEVFLNYLCDSGPLIYYIHIHPRFQQKRIQEAKRKVIYSRHNKPTLPSIDFPHPSMTRPHLKMDKPPSPATLPQDPP